MINEELHHRVADAIEQLRAQVITLAESQQEWARLTASGSPGDIDDLDYLQIAAVATQAHREAVTELARKTAELVEPLRAQAMTNMRPGEPAPGLPDPVTAVPGLSTAPQAALPDEAYDTVDPKFSQVLDRAW